MGHHLIDDALEKQDEWEPIPYNEELLDNLYIKISYKTIINTPNDTKLGKLIRDIYWDENKK
jgi:hypothetical protein